MAQPAMTARLQQNEIKFNKFKKALNKRLAAATGSNDEIDEMTGCVILNTDRSVWLPWHQLGNARIALQSNQIIWLGQYREEIEGVVMAFGEIKPPPGVTAMPISASEPVFHVRYQCELVVFQPKVNAHYMAVISESSMSGTVAHIQDSVQCTIALSHIKLSAGDCVLVTVTAVRVHSHMLQLHADLHSVVKRGTERVSNPTSGASTAVAGRIGSAVNVSALFTRSAQPSTSQSAPSTCNHDDPIILEGNTSAAGRNITNNSDEPMDVSVIEPVRKHKKKKKRRDSELSQTSLNGNGLGSLATVICNGTTVDEQLPPKQKKQLPNVNPNQELIEQINATVSPTKHKKKKKRKD